MKKILAALLLAVAASPAAAGQTCQFVVRQDAPGSRLFHLTPPSNMVGLPVINYGRTEPAPDPLGVYWLTGIGRYRMEVTRWSEQAIDVRIPDYGQPVCGAAYGIELVMPNLSNRLLPPCIWAATIMLSRDNAPDGNDPRCGAVLPPTMCVLQATPAVVNAGEWVELSTVPLDLVSEGQTATLSCADGTGARDLPVGSRNGRPGVALETGGLTCPLNQYRLRVGECAGPVVINPLPAPCLPTDPNCQSVTCDQLRAAANFQVQVGRALPGQPVTATLLAPGGSPLPANNTVMLPGVATPVAVASVQWSVSRDPGGASPLAPGGDYVLRDGSNQQATFAVAPPVQASVKRVEELATVRYYAHATVTLTTTLPTGQTLTCAVPAWAPFDLPALPVPQVLALFRRADFNNGPGIGWDAGTSRRAVLVLMPGLAVDHAGQPITDIEGLLAELNWLTSVLPLGSFADSSPLASLALYSLGLRRLADELSRVRADSEYKSEFLRFGEVYSLRDIRLKPNGPLAEDLFNSLILTGPPDTWAEFFNNQKYVEDQGSFELRLSPGSYLAAVRSLTFKNDADAAAQVQGGNIRVRTAPGGPKYAIFGNEIWGDNICCHQAETFGAELSSLRIHGVRF